jgi:hypothetical protein
MSDEASQDVEKCRRRAWKSSLLAVGFVAQGRGIRRFLVLERASLTTIRKEGI